jgi:hypothetical protein
MTTYNPSIYPLVVAAFNYVPQQHDVYQVTRDAFLTCQPSAPQTVRVWASGSDVVDLAAPAGGLLLRLQRHRTLLRRHEALRLRGHGAPAPSFTASTASFSATSPAGVPDAGAGAGAELRRRGRATRASAAASSSDSVANARDSTVKLRRVLAQPARRAMSWCDCDRVVD